MERERSASLLRQLQEKIHGIERENRSGAERARISSGLPALDALLPGGGFASGTLVEWLSEGFDESATTLAIMVAGNLMRGRGTLVVVDARREFFPPGAAKLGVDLDRTVVAQPEDAQAEVWALEQSLRSEAVSAAVGWIDDVSDTVLRRLQLAAEIGGGIGLLVRPASRRTTKSWADMRLLVHPVPTGDSPAAPWRVRVEMLHCRGGFPGGNIVLDLNR